MHPTCYTGHLEDSSTGLVYMQARYYAPAIGRFYSPDPIGYQDQLNLYAYVGNDPVNNIDPTGEYIESLIDIGFLVADVAAIAKTGFTAGNVAAVVGDLAGLATPGATGGGLAARAVVEGARAAAKSADKAGDAAKVSTKGEKSYQTYTKTNAKTGEVYSGRTSGNGSPTDNVKARDANHHMNDKGFGPAQLDKSSSNPDAIRGREQQLIGANGGAKSQGGSSGNAINGISSSNPKAEQYMKACNDEFCK